MKETKTHWRKVHKSDHLGTADLEELMEEGKGKLIFTIKNVKQEYSTQVAGKKIDANIAYFVEPIKPLVLNSTNSKMVKKFTGSAFVEDWNNVLIELFIDSSVKMKGEIVGGVRVRSIQPIVTKPLLNDKSDKWNAAKKRVAEGMSIQDVRKHYQVSQSDYDKLCL
tara:strand:- start:284 stop:781 length:498 start_codon:yes stop_codon:yes gene_type:complete